MALELSGFTAAFGRSNALEAVFRLRPVVSVSWITLWIGLFAFEKCRNSKPVQVCALLSLCAFRALGGIYRVSACDSCHTYLNLTYTMDNWTNPSYSNVLFVLGLFNVTILSRDMLTPNVRASDCTAGPPPPQIVALEHSMLWQACKYYADAKAKPMAPWSRADHQRPAARKGLQQTARPDNPGRAKLRSCFLSIFVIWF